MSFRKWGRCCGSQPTSAIGKTLLSLRRPLAEKKEQNTQLHFSIWWKKTSFRGVHKSFGHLRVTSTRRCLGSGFMMTPMPHYISWFVQSCRECKVYFAKMNTLPVKRLPFIIRFIHFQLASLDSWEKKKEDQFFIAAVKHMTLCHIAKAL